jgi:hypothetical protein
MKRHHGRWLRLEGADQLRKIELSGGRLAPKLAPNEDDDSQDVDLASEEKCERGDLNPHGFYPTGS